MKHHLMLSRQRFMYGRKRKMNAEKSGWILLLLFSKLLIVLVFAAPVELIIYNILQEKRGSIILYFQTLMVRCLVRCLVRFWSTTRIWILALRSLSRLLHLALSLCLLVVFLVSILSRSLPLSTVVLAFFFFFIIIIRINT